ncbi:MAG: murein biosynthesis integral membrane protein MurJ [Elusimicrobia bacterium RIFOXYD2_FULL_34_15]|nr:MAG: murein biosynthesis integral membrane protein MurJ [Elusimicrobia bacterium RIFOXYD2_FULL_34_15]
MSTNIKIAKAYVILITASVVGSILSLGKEMLVAKYFGISKAMDAFYTALTIPNSINAITVSTFGITFLPIFVQYKTKDKEEANHLASIAINYMFIFLFLIAIILFIFSKQIVTNFFNGLNPETSMLAINILKILSITMIFTGLVGTITWILNAFENFSAPSFSQMFITISIITFIFFFTKSMGVYIFAWGTLAGLFIQFVFLLPFLKRKGYKHYFDFNIRHPAMKKTLNFSLTFFLLGVISSLTAIINRSMASWLPSGSIAALGYADKLVQVPLVIFSGSIATAIYPFFASQFAENKIEDMKDTLATSIKMTGFIFIPLAVVMIILSKPTIQALFQRGVFDEHATNLTSIIFICYTLQLFSNFAVVVMARLLLVFQDMLSYVKITITGIVLTVILNFIFIKTVNPPAAGIALSTSLVCLITAILYFIYLKKKIHNLHGISILKSLSKTTFFAIISGIIIFVVFRELNALIPKISLFNRLFKIICSASIGMASFIAISFLLKFEEADKIYKLVKTKIRSFVKR